MRLPWAWCGNGGAKTVAPAAAEGYGGARPPGPGGAAPGKTRVRCSQRPGRAYAAELYALREDPGEWKNLAADAGYAPVRLEMQQRLLEHILLSARPVCVR